ncbi:CRISPR-associated endonuclease Cas2 [Streptomyces halobius]|uniref:CRISPR-associated endoribonuclease Cas2 n=1 Tax=Streptomyces halobius TaxID=2879846 RepID=A0ABY4M2X3_9ACTN|nr:CRISPR-associated endonuclease Cas2 [Streptomyces halobius]UQA90751.1 CRISPR-associated endonuclease Cas2 [Streptomyces halobius]
MYVVVVYDTAAERNPKILRICRKYLHHVQRSVFEGNLTDGQLRRFQAAVESVLDLSYDNVLVYSFPPAAVPVRHAWGAAEPEPTDII